MAFMPAIHSTRMCLSGVRCSQGTRILYLLPNPFQAVRLTQNIYKRDFAQSAIMRGMAFTAPDCPLPPSVIGKIMWKKGTSWQRHFDFRSLTRHQCTTSIVAEAFPRLLHMLIWSIASKFYDTQLKCPTSSNVFIFLFRLTQGPSAGEHTCGSHSRREILM